MKLIFLWSSNYPYKINSSHSLLAIYGLDKILLVHTINDTSITIQVISRDKILLAYKSWTSTSNRVYRCPWNSGRLSILTLTHKVFRGVRVSEFCMHQSQKKIAIWGRGKRAEQTGKFDFSRLVGNKSLVGSVFY